MSANALAPVGANSRSMVISVPSNRQFTVHWAALRAKVTLWVNTPHGDQENRVQAASRIFKCFLTQSAELTLPCNLRDLPTDVFRYLPQITVLDLSGNELSDLSSELLSPLSKLTVLRASGNKIRLFPEQFLKSCRSLRELDLSCNQIESIPEELSVFFQRLQYLHLFRNPEGGKVSLNIPESFFTQVVAATVRRYFNFYETLSKQPKTQFVYCASRAIRDLTDNEAQCINPNIEGSFAQINLPQFIDELTQFRDFFHLLFDPTQTRDLNHAIQDLGKSNDVTRSIVQAEAIVDIHPQSAEKETISVARMIVGKVGALKSGEVLNIPCGTFTHTVVCQIKRDGEEFALMIINTGEGCGDTFNLREPYSERRSEHTRAKCFIQLTREQATNLDMYANLLRPLIDESYDQSIEGLYRTLESFLSDNHYRWSTPYKTQTWGNCGFLSIQTAIVDPALPQNLRLAFDLFRMKRAVAHMYKLLADKKNRECFNLPTTNILITNPIKSIAELESVCRTYLDQRPGAPLLSNERSAVREFMRRPWTSASIQEQQGLWEDRMREKGVEIDEHLRSLWREECLFASLLS